MNSIYASKHLLINTKEMNTMSDVNTLNVKIDLRT